MILMKNEEFYYPSEGRVRGKQYGAVRGESVALTTPLDGGNRKP